MIFEKLLASGRAKSALAAYRFGKSVAYVKFGCIERKEGDLRNSLSALNGLGDCAVIVKRDHNLTAVVTVDNANLVSGRKTSLGSHSATGENKTYKPLGDSHSKSCVDKLGFAGSDNCRLVKERI